jgi:23S rRNA pseudouridine955/2504/2580 synthase
MYQKVISSREEGQRLDKYLHKVLPDAGTSFIYKMLRRKNITLNDAKAEGSIKLSAGDILRIYFSDETLEKFMGHGSSGTKQKNAVNEYSDAFRKLGRIGILYESENILAADKPSGVLSQKSDKDDISVNEWLIGHMLGSGEITPDELDSFHPSVCNRLDRNTSGIILCGKTIVGEQVLSEMLRDRTMDKFYLAAVCGHIAAPEEITGYLIKDTASNTVQVFSEMPDDADGMDEIHTFYRPLCYNSAEDMTLLEVKLITGKTHQIRAHLSSIGHPIAGDPKYGNARVNRRIRDSYGVRSQLLHCARVVFPAECSLDELSGLEISSGIPDGFKAFFKYDQMEEIKK